MMAVDNNQKYRNYKEQIGRLNKAIKYGFLIEAVAIEYAIMEDRLESVLIHEGVFNPDKHGTLVRKLNRIRELQRRKGSLENKYLSVELLDSIASWKDERNALIHALLKQNLSTQELLETAENGYAIVKQLTSKVTSIRRQLEKTESKKKESPPNV